jgi:hypothetical protein
LFLQEQIKSSSSRRTSAVYCGCFHPSAPRATRFPGSKYEPPWQQLATVGNLRQCPSSWRLAASVLDQGRVILGQLSDGMSGEGRPEVSNAQAPCPSRAAGGIDRDRKVCEETMLHRSQTPRGPIVCVSPSFPPPIPLHPHQRGTTVVIEREYTATYCSHSGAWLSCLQCVHATGDRRPWRVDALRPSRVCSAFNMVNVPYMSVTTPMVSGAVTNEVCAGLMRILGTTGSSNCALFPARLSALRHRQQHAGSARTQSGPPSKSSVCPMRLKQVL